MKTLSTSLLSTFLIIILLFSCDKKELFESPQTAPVSFVQNTNRLDVGQAQSWFEQNVNLLNKTARTSANKPIKKVNWDVAMQMFSTKRGQYLQIPISYENVKSLTFSDKKNGKGSSEALPIPTEMLYIYNDKGKYNYYVVELLPDEEYLKKLQKKGDKPQIFNKREYTGYFFVKDWNDVPKEGWYMKNGKVTRQLSPTTIKKNGRLMGCDWFTRLHFSLGCVTSGNGGGEVVVFGTSWVIPGNDPSAGTSLASTIPKPDGYNCNFNEWEFTEADVFIDCNFDDTGSIPDPITDFPFIPIYNNTIVINGTFSFFNYFNQNFGLNIIEQNFYSTFPWVIPQVIVNESDSRNKMGEIYCGDETGDYYNGNAFKHAYFSALNTWSFGADMARTMGQIHEVGSNSLHAEMDLFNNELGVQIALQLPSSAGDEALKNAILTAIINGNGRRIALLNDGATLNFTFPTDGSNRCW